MNTKKLLGTIIGVIMFAALIAGATFAWLTYGNVEIGEHVLTANAVNFVVNYETGSAVTDIPVLDSSKLIAYNYLEEYKPAILKITLKKNTTGSYTVNMHGEDVLVNPNPDGHASIWLKTTSNNKLTKDGIVRWAICRGASGTTCGLSNGEINMYFNDDMTVKSASAEAGNVTILNSGIVTESGEIPLLSDAVLANDDTKTGSALVAGCKTENGLSTCPGSTSNKMLLTEEGVTYTIFLWLDAKTITNEHLDDQYDKTADGKVDLEGGIKYDLYSGYVYASATQLQK